MLGASYFCLYLQNGIHKKRSLEQLVRLSPKQGHFKTMNPFKLPITRTQEKKLDQLVRLSPKQGHFKTMNPFKLPITRTQEKKLDQLVRLNPKQGHFKTMSPKATEAMLV
jgi:hypothetical protein